MRKLKKILLGVCCVFLLMRPEAVYATEDVDIGGESREDVQEALLAVQDEYPEGAEWNDGYFYESKGLLYDAESGWTSCQGIGGHAFALMLSDAAFGSMAIVKHYDFDEIRIGDIIKLQSFRSVVVTDIDGDTLTVAEGNVGGGYVHWDGKMSRASTGNWLYILTRANVDSSDQDRQPRSQEFDSVEAFVERMYSVVLLREADQEGMNTWTGRLNSGTANAVDIVQGFFCSPEYISKNKSNGEMVSDCYNAMLGRGPDEEGYNNWVSKLENGMSINAIFAGFVGSDEFALLCSQYEISPGTYQLTEDRDKNPGVTMFVSRLYTKALGRSFDTEGLNTWCRRINADPGRDSVIEVAADGFFHSDEFLNRGLDNAAFVTVLYHTFLDRIPDESGHANWVEQLERGEKTRDQVIEGFAYSPEFSNIMASYGL